MEILFRQPRDGCHLAAEGAGFEEQPALRIAAERRVQQDLAIGDLDVDVVLSTTPGTLRTYTNVGGVLSETSSVSISAPASRRAASSAAAARS